jgi:outer membrane biosynthesis protein TonB
MISVAARDDNFKRSLAVSAGVHLALLLFLYFGLPHLLKPLPVHHDQVPFEIVEIADLTNTKIKDEVKPEPPAPPPQPAPPPAPAPQVATPTPPPPKPAAPSTPTPPAPEAESIKPKPVERVKAVEPPKPKPDLMASVLKNVAKLKPAETTKPTDAKLDAKAPPQPEAKSSAPTLSSRLTISEEDALRRQIEHCWSPPMGARDAQSLIVEVTIDVNPDRTIANAEIVDKGRYNSDSFFRAAGDAAIRAVRNPQCSPLELPADKYDQWKHIDFTFDPRDM